MTREKLSADEKSLLDSVERGERKARQPTSPERAELARAAAAKLRKDQRVNIRLSRHDLEALRRRLGTSWAKSMTSREIARRSELPASDRSALRMLVGAVEISRFGGQSANEQIYRACLDQYRLIGESGMARP